MGNIGEMLSNETKEERAINRKVFLTTLHNISFLAQQGLPLIKRSGRYCKQFSPASSSSKC